MKRKIVILATLAPLMIILDQITKWWATSTLKGKPPIEVMANFFHFRYVENRGAAWGFLGSLGTHYRIPFFVVLTIVAMIFLLKYYKDMKESQVIGQISLALIMGGAIGNFIDRVFVTYVVDFIDWHFYDKRWPTFNIADVAISVGVALLFLVLFKEAKEEKRLKKLEATNTETEQD